jgi:hypothetical protein
MRSFFFLVLFVGVAGATPPVEGDLEYEVRDAGGALIPCKLSFVGVAGTPTPAFTRNDIGRQEGGAVAAFNRLMSATGQGRIRLPVGRYDVWISRGPEWDVKTLRAVQIGPRPATVTAQLRHVVDSRGWLSGDFHVHAAASPDSHVPMQDRVYEFVSDGVELLVSTDHNVVADYEPIIRELGLGKYLASLPGDELTTGGWGHFGAFPLTPDLERAGQGATLVHGRTAADFFADVRRIAPLAVIDVHHPCIDAEIGYFALCHYDAAADRSDRRGFSYDFDAIEVLNGYQDAERKHVDHVIRDWFELLDHGHLVTATGNSDTHHLDHNIGGYPRNYVRLTPDDPSAVTPDAISKAVRGHHAFFTTGPFVRASIDGASFGDLARTRTGRVDLDVEVQAAPWIAVNVVTIYVDGRVEKTIPVPAATTTVRFRARLPITVERDAYVVVRVDGDKPLAPIAGDLTRFDVRPLALTNPIFIDADGNGRFDPRQLRQAAQRR